MPSLCSKQQLRRNSFKKGVTSEDSRRKREDKTISVRKNKREDKLRKRRNKNPAKPTESSGAIVPAGTTPIPTITDLPALKQAIASQDRPTRYEAVRQVRKLLSKEQAPPALEVIQAGLLPVLVNYLGHTNDHEIQFEASWALTNISSTDHTRAVVECGAVGPLVLLLKSPNADVREQCLWCLGNVAGDGAELRNLVLGTPGAIEALLLNIQHPANISMLRNATWTLSNFCRGKPQSALESIRPVLPALAKLVQCSDHEVVSDASWALSYVSDGANDRIDAVCKTGVVPKLIELLASEKANVVTPALRTIGNIASGNDLQTQAIVDAGVLVKCAPLLAHVKKSIRKEACWTLSNIAAGNNKQIAALMSNRAIMKTVITIAEEGQWEVRKEAAWVISNVCTGGSSENIKTLVELGTLQSLVSLLSVSDPTVVTVALDGISSILKKADDLAAYVMMIDELEGIDAIENLQQHEDEDIYNKAVKMIEQYFDGDEEDEENSGPQNNVNGGTEFGFSQDSTNMFAGNSMTTFAF